MYKRQVHDTQGIIIQLILSCVKFVNVGIQHEERIGVPKGTHEFTLSFLYGLSVETVGQPGRTVEDVYKRQISGSVRNARRYIRPDAVSSIYYRK